MKPILYVKSGVTDGFERMNVLEQAKDGSWFKLSGVSECDVLGCWVMIECLDGVMGRPMTDDDGNVLYYKEYGSFKIELIQDAYEASANKDADLDPGPDYGPWATYNPFTGALIPMAAPSTSQRKVNSAPGLAAGYDTTPLVSPHNLPRDVVDVYSQAANRLYRKGAPATKHLFSFNDADKQFLAWIAKKQLVSGDDGPSTPFLMYLKEYEKRTQESDK